MSSSSPSGMNSPDTISAHIESITHEGHGVAHVDGKAVFIEGALPGETVRYRTLNRGKTYDLGRMIEIVEASPDRVTPRCPYFGVCGGCSLQHLRAEAQLPAKQQILHDNLTRIGKVEPESCLPALAGPHWGYRRKARLGARVVQKKGGVIVGFREKRSAYLTALASCEVLHPRVSTLLPALRNLIATLSTPNRVPQIEVAVGDNATAFVFRHLVPLTADDEAQLADFGRQHDIQIFRQPGRPDQLVPVWPESPAPLVYRLPGANVELEEIGNYANSVQYWDKVIEIGPENAWVYNNRGYDYYLLREYEQAIQDYDKAIELDPEHTFAYGNRGYVYFVLGQYERAIQDYNKAIEIDHQSLIDYNNRGYAYFLLGDYRRAIQDYDKVIELDPEYQWAYYNRGLAYAFLEQYDRAIQDYDKAIELDPEDAAAYNDRGNCYRYLERCDREHFDDGGKLDELLG